MYAVAPKKASIFRHFTLKKLKLKSLIRQLFLQVLQILLNSLYGFWAIRIRSYLYGSWFFHPYPKKLRNPWSVIFWLFLLSLKTYVNVHGIIKGKEKTLENKTYFLLTSWKAPRKWTGSDSVISVVLIPGSESVSKRQGSGTLFVPFSSATETDFVTLFRQHIAAAASWIIYQYHIQYQESWRK